MELRKLLRKNGIQVLNGFSKHTKGKELIIDCMWYSTEVGVIIIQGNILAKDSVVDFLGRAIFSYVSHFFCLYLSFLFQRDSFAC